jgi:MFS family permease
MATSAIVSVPSGALVDRFGGKRLILVGMLLSAVGFGAFAFVTTPLEAFTASLVAGAGAGMNGAGAPSLTAALTTREERAAAFSFQRVAVNLGIGGGAVIGGVIVARGSLSSYQLVYLLDAATFLGFLVFLAAVPDARAPSREAHEERSSYRRVVRDRSFLALLAVNVLFVLVAYTFFAAITGPYTRHVAHFGGPAIGVIFAANTLFIILAQLPVTHAFRARNRIGVLRLAVIVWAGACVAMVPAAHLNGETRAVAAVAIVGIAFGIGECLHAVAIGPLAVDLASPQLMGRYMALFAISWSAGLALGPTVGGGLLALTPDLPWLAGAALLFLTMPLLAYLRRSLPESIQQVEPAPSQSQALSPS